MFKSDNGAALNHGSGRGLPRNGSNNGVGRAGGSSMSSVLTWMKPHRKLLVGLCTIMLAACVFISMSIMVGQTSSSEVKRREQASLKLMVAEMQQAQQLVPKEAPAAATAGVAQAPAVQQQQEQQQQLVGSDIAEASTASSGSTEQLSAGSDTTASLAEAAGTPEPAGYRGKRHKRPRVRDNQEQQQEGQQQQQTPDTAVGSATVPGPFTVHAELGHDELPLPQLLQDSLLTQQVAVVPAVAASGSANTSGGGGVSHQAATGAEHQKQPGSDQQHHFQRPQHQQQQQQQQGFLPSLGSNQTVVTPPPPSPAPPVPAPQAPALAAGLPAGVDPEDATSKYILDRGTDPARLRFPVWWHGPMWAGSGYGSEAINYVLSLVRTGRLAPADVWAYHHGDAWREHVVNGLAAEDRQELEYLQSLPAKYKGKRAAIIVCHSVPVNWAFPEPMWTAGAPCPPSPRDFGWVYMVGRTMFETDRLPALFVPRLNAMNEVWVPSEWQREAFIASGVAADKLVVVPEGVNTSQFDPALYTPMTLTGKAQLVFGRPWAAKLAERQQQDTMASTNRAMMQDSNQPQPLRQQQRQQAVYDGKHAEQGQWRQEDADFPTTDANSARSGEPVGSGSIRNAASTSFSSGSRSSHPRKPFVFISTFKWEQRKGWDVLLQAYLSEFTSEDDVELYILTKPFSDSGSGFKEKMRSWADKLYGSKSAVSSATQPTTPPRKVPAAGRLRVAAPVSQLTAVPASAAAKAGQSRQLLEQQQLVEPQLQQQQQQGLSSRLAQCSGALGTTNCSSALLEGIAASIAPDHDLDSYAGYSIEQQQVTRSLLSSGLLIGAGNEGEQGEGDLEQQTKANALDAIAQIRQYVEQHLTETAATASSSTQQQRRLMADSQDATSVEDVLASAMARKAAAAAGSAADAAADPSGKPKQQQQKPAAKPSEKDAAAATAEEAAAKYPTLYVVDSHISDADFPRFYKAGDAFVLPTRGEGWGRPHVEAMSMGLPVISTNWSGITAYLNERVGYPISVEKLTPVQGGNEVVWWFKGLKWAQPSVQHLRQLMRRVYTNRAEAAARGRAARQLMVERYSPEPLADLLVAELQRIEATIP